MKKTIAKHTLGLIGVGTLWFILSEVLEKWWFAEENKDYPSYWNGDIFQARFNLGDGGKLLLEMIIIYFLIYWAVKTIWFDKDKDSQKGD